MFPSDLWLEIILHVDWIDLKSISLVSIALSKICGSEQHFDSRIHKEYDNFMGFSTTSPTSCYKSLYQKLKRFETRRTRVFRIPETVYGEDHGDVHQEEFSEEDRLRASKIALAYLEGTPLRRGDVVLFDSITDPGGPGRYIFDGKDLELFNYDEQCKWGVVPSSYQICDDDLTFCERYWEEVARNKQNRIVYFNCEKYIDEIMENLKIMETTPKSGKNIGISSFTHSSGMRFEINFIFDNRYEITGIRKRLSSKIFSWRNFPMKAETLALLDVNTRDLYKNYSWLYEEPTDTSLLSPYSLRLDLCD